MTAQATTGAQKPGCQAASWRLRMASMVAIAILGLPSCGKLPALNHRLSALPLSPAQGWVFLPTARWLLNAGIEPTELVLCPRDACAEQSFVTRMELTGLERSFADRVASDPVRTLGLAKPGRLNVKAPAKRTIDIIPLAIGPWRGGLVRLGSSKDPDRAAHVAVLARRDGDAAHLLMAVATTAEAARAQASLALN